MAYYYGETADSSHASGDDGGGRAFALPVRLLVCFFLCATALIAKVFFPAQTAAVLGRLGVSVDYREAAEAIGRAVGGEEEVGEALREAWDSAVDTADNAPVPAAAEEQGAAPVFAARYEEPLTAAYAGEPVPAEEPTYDEAAVAAFRETQAPYASRGVPERATYEMPVLALDCICPVMGTVSSTFGYRTHPVDGAVRFHYGTDVAAPAGTEVDVFADGTVKTAGNSASYGRYVMVEHEDGVVSLYAHMSKVCVKAGDSVLKGDKVGEVGSTGNATGACLHFELRVDGLYVNPEYYVSWS